MDSRRLRGFRLACGLVASAAALAQSGPRMRLVVVDSSGRPANATWRTPTETPALSALAREIVRNESAAVDMCLSYLDAQLAYFRSAPRTDGQLAFAEKIRSTAGMRDGLYWHLEGAGEESPLGPRFAAAAAAELDPVAARPLFGYYFKVLVAQGPDAAGGARDYRVGGRLTNGFALVAWPAEYGVTGVRTFQVNHLGDVYAKDLGSDTSRTATMTTFALDRTWVKVASAVD